MTYIVASLIVACGVLFGIYQGMVMTQAGDRRCYYWDEGVRSHYWYDIYHRTWMLVYLVPLLIGMFADDLAYIGNTICILLGALVIGWQCFEWFYSWTRYATFVPDIENVFGTGIYVDNINALHAVRLAVGTALVLWGAL